MAFTPAKLVDYVPGVKYPPGTSFKASGTVSAAPGSEYIPGKNATLAPVSAPAPITPQNARSLAPALIRPPAPIVAPVAPIVAPVPMRANAPIIAPMNNRVSEPIVMQGTAKPMERQKPTDYIRSFLQPIASKVANTFMPSRAEASPPVTLLQKQEEEAKRKSNSPVAVAGIRG